VRQRPEIVVIVAQHADIGAAQDLAVGEFHRADVVRHLVFFVQDRQKGSAGNDERGGGSFCHT
jgi:hypothetical protein